MTQSQQRLTYDGIFFSGEHDSILAVKAAELAGRPLPFLDHHKWEEVGPRSLGGRGRQGRVKSRLGREDRER